MRRGGGWAVPRPTGAPGHRGSRLLRRCLLWLATLSTACSAGFTPGDTAQGADASTAAATPTRPAGTDFGAVDSGTKALQRLDVVSFDNTVHDLTGTAQTLAHDTFPQDNRFNNFDNVGPSLGLSGALQMAWIQAAAALGAEVAQSAGTDAGRTEIYLKVAPCAQGNNLNADACLAKTVRDFGLRAWRRPLSEAEAASIVALADAGGTDLPTRVGTAVTALLSSPHFFFRVEIDPNPNAPQRTPSTPTSWPPASPTFCGVRARTTHCWRRPKAGGC